MSSIAVLVAGDDADVGGRARDLGARLGIDVVECGDDEFELLVAVTAEGLELRQPHERVRPVTADFTSGRFRRRVARLGRRSLIARALGYKGQPLRVLDTTAGLGTDAMTMACLGCDVTAVERDGVVHALLEDGLSRALHADGVAEAAGRVGLLCADGIQVVSRSGEPFDVVYLDPMFPVRRKTALPSRELQALARLVGRDETHEGELLLEAALRSGAARVVVKRADDGPVLDASDRQGPDVQFSGRTARFDVYLGGRE